MDERADVHSAISNKFTELLTWRNNHTPNDDMLYKKAYFDTINYWDQAVREIFFGTNGKILSDNISNTQINVVGEHTSKSIVNPVLKITYRDVEIVFRYNFYDYEITVIGDVPITLIGLLSNSNTSFCYQGFPDRYRLDKPYHPGYSAFSIAMNSHGSFYTFLYIVKNQIDIGRNKFGGKAI